MMAVGSPKDEGSKRSVNFGSGINGRVRFSSSSFATAMICFGIKMILRSLEFGEDSLTNVV